MANIMKRTLMFFTALFVYYVIATPMHFWVLTKRQFFTMLPESIFLWYFVTQKYFPDENIYVRLLITVVLTLILAYPILRYITPHVVDLLKNQYIITIVFVLCVMFIHCVILGNLMDSVLIAALLTIISIFIIFLIYLNVALSKGKSSLVMYSEYLANPILATFFIIWVTWSFMWLIHETTLLI